MQIISTQVVGVVMEATWIEGDITTGGLAQPLLAIPQEAMVEEVAAMEEGLGAMEAEVEDMEAGEAEVEEEAMVGPHHSKWLVCVV